ncbi:Acg family FMN-binding oxidoreductase [Mycobacterium sp. IDR2000157661]|uniref:Acg family FMN-binding oxidoreductase n=1 Tax=Mycobacterium sp. IDR2000157661 TaxID=2867005 RepID=UPI001EECB389|nr:NAD(P)H nitroreductase [Mycobacterium sp. IDR2000157661]ULE33424.1 NAD(P)H nitroreductase [Mycobacterium sp. IDR2000157661]
MRDTLVETDVIRSAVELACRAPSLYNSQPWHWVVDDSGVHLHLDKDRVLYSADHSGREALLGCGAVLDHFRVAMAAAGWRANIDRYPNPNRPLHLASVEFSPMDFVTEGHRRRADAILLRRTDRLPFAEPPEWPAVESTLRRAVVAESVRFDVIADELRPELAEASKLTEELRLYDSSYHSEMDWWTAPFATDEGIPPDTLVSEAERDRVDVGRAFPVAHHDRERRAALGRDRSKILVLSTYDSERVGVLQCGEMLSAVLLEATMAGLATCPLSHITEVQASRDVVASLTDQSTTPQILIRIGLAPEIENVPPPTPRRPVDEVLEIGPRTS